MTPPTSSLAAPTPIRRGMRDLLATYLALQWRRVALLLALLLIGTALELAGPLIVRAFLDDVTTQIALRDLLMLAAWFLATAVGAQAILVARTFVAERISWSAANRLRSDLTLHCLTLDRDFHQQHTPGELIERVDGDVKAMGTFFSPLLPQLLTDLLLLGGIIILCWRLDWRVGVGILASTAVALAAVTLLRNAGVQPWKRARQASADLFGFIEERLSGMEDVRALGAVPHILRQHSDHERALWRRMLAAGVRGSANYHALSIILAVGTAILLAIGTTLYGQGIFTLGTIYLLYSYANLLRQPIEELGRHLQELQATAASVARVVALQALRSPIADGVGPPPPPGPLAVAFEQVDFAYADGEDLTLRDISFALAPGERLGILGSTGSGKTTLTRLLFRFYDPTRGTVRLNGVATSAAPLATIRGRIGLVTQEIQLFHATVRDNLTFFDSTIPDEHILAVLADLGLESWLATLPDGLNTPLAPDGGGLSAGEGQLLAFARVFLQAPDLVILDEASSRLDLATERLIQQAIDRLLADRTGIIIAHRLATVERVDTILLLNDGLIVEYGSRERLARDPHSRFAELLQVGMQEVLT